MKRSDSSPAESVYKKEYDIFISYRREGGEYLAKMIYDKLVSLGYRPFLDVETMRAGKFNEQLYEVIGKCSDFLLLLTPHALDRCVNEEDWVRKEVTHALSLGKNVIPIRTKDFAWPERLPDELAPLPHYEAMVPSTQYFDAWIDKLCGNMLQAKPARGHRKKTTVLLAAAVAVLACGAVLAALLSSRGGGPAASVPSPSPAPTAEPAPSPTPAPTVEPTPAPTAEPVYHIVLTPDTELSISSLESDIDLLRRRLDIFAGPEGYELSVQTGSIDLYLSPALFGPSDPNAILDCYITRATDLYAMDPDAHFFKGEQALPVGRGDIASAVYRTGRIEGLDTDAYGLPAHDDYGYIELTLTDDFARENADTISRWGDRLHFGHDLEKFTSYYYFATAPAGDGKTFYLFLDEELDVCLELEEFDLNCPAMNGSFSHIITSYNQESLYHVLVTPSSALTMSQYAGELELFRQRAEAVLGQGKFFLSDRGTSFDLYISKLGLSEDKLQAILERHLTRPNDLYLYDSGDESGQTPPLALERSDLADVELLDTEGDDGSRYIRITLTEACAARVAEAAAGWQSPAAALDMEQCSPWYGYPTEVSEDFSSLTITVPDTTYHYPQLIEHILTHEPYAAAMEYTLLLDDIVWEQPDGSHPLQCAADELEGPSVTMLYTNYQSDMTDWAYRYVLEEFMCRLDAIGIPYAIGARPDQDWTVAVRTGLDRMSLGMMDTLGAETASVTIRAGMREWSSYSASLEYLRDEDGVCTGVLVRAGNYASREMDSFAAAAAEEGADIVLSLEGDPLLVCDSASYASDGTLVFDRTRTGEPVAEACPWLADLMERLVYGSMPAYLLDSWQFEPGPDGTQPTEEDFGLADSSLPGEKARLKNAVISAVGEAEPSVRPDVSFYRDTFGEQCVSIGLHIDADDQLPGRAVNAFRAICEAADLTNSPFSQVLVCLMDEDTLTGERARLYLLKQYDTYPHGENVSAGATPPVLLGGVFANGRVAAYIDQFRERIEADPVLSALEQDVSYLRDGMPVSDGLTDG